MMQPEELKKRKMKISAIFLFLLLLGIIGYANRNFRFERSVLPQMPEKIAGVDGTVRKIQYARNYGEIYDTLLKIWSRQNSNNSTGDANALIGAVGEDEALPAGTGRTGIVVAGDDKAAENILESVAVDENYIYRGYGRRGFAIIKADGSRMEQVWGTKLEEYLMHIYVQADIMAVIGSGHTEDGNRAYQDALLAQKQDYTKVYIYNIKDRSNPILLHTLWQSGWYEESRLQGEYVYMVTREEVPVHCEKRNAGAYIPIVNGTKLSPNRIAITEDAVNASYLTITSVNLEKPEQYADSKALLTGASDYYIGENNWYIMNALQMESDVYNDEECTEIYRMSVCSGVLDFEEKTRIKGYLKDSRSINVQKNEISLWMEVNKLEKVTVTDKLFHHRESYTQSAGQQEYLYKLDGNLNRLETVEMSKKSEEPAWYSKYGEYVQEYGKNRKLVICRVTKKEAKKAGTDEYGIRLSMYDVTEAENEKELHSIMLKGYGFSDIWKDDKAVMFDAKSGIFGMAAERTGVIAEEVQENLVQGKRKSRKKRHGEYMLWTYDEEKGFVNVLAVPLRYGESWGIRGVLRKNMLYIIETGNGKRIESYDIKDKIFVDEIKKYNTKVERMW